MADNTSKDIQVKEKTSTTPAVEQTQPGRVFTPAVDIFENDQAIILLADMPGVKTDKLDIDLRDDVLTISGGVKAPEDSTECSILAEYEVGRYFRRFTLSEVIDQAKIDAKLNNGVLRLTLPKVQKATPRKITVQAG